jgi:Na+/melibiose symporter-like transporter
MRIVGFVFAGILVFFGVLFIWGSFSPQGQWGWIIVGLVSVGLGLGILFLASRSKEKPSEQQAAKVHIDLPANINLDTLKCQSCGGNLTLENIQLVAGSPVVHCPYCHTTYQLTEEPKW